MMGTPTQDGRGAKLQRLMPLLRGVNAPRSVLVEVTNAVLQLDETTDEPAITRRRLTWAMRKSVETLQVELTLPRTGGGRPFRWVVSSLRRVLQEICASCDGFARLVDALYVARPCTPNEPYGLVVYSDEVTPGDVLHLNNERKMMNMLVTIRDFGSDALAYDCAWIPVAVLRAKIIKEVDGRWSCALRMWLRLTFLGDESVRDGFVVKLHHNNLSLIHI